MRLSHLVNLTTVRSPVRYGRNALPPLRLDLPYRPDLHYHLVQFDQRARYYHKGDERFRHDWLLVSPTPYPELIQGEDLHHPEAEGLIATLRDLTPEEFFGESSLGTLHRISDLVREEIELADLTEPQLYVIRNANSQSSKRVRAVWISNPAITTPGRAPQTLSRMETLKVSLQGFPRTLTLLSREDHFREVDLTLERGQHHLALLTFSPTNGDILPHTDPYAQRWLVETTDLSLYTLRGYLQRKGLEVFEEGNPKTQAHVLESRLGPVLQRQHLKVGKIYLSYTESGNPIRGFVYRPR